MLLPAKRRTSSVLLSGQGSVPPVFLFDFDRARCPTGIEAAQPQTTLWALDFECD